ncbi:adenosylcobinamide-GDP ribazoletransferase [Geminicoccus harenae]|uniref:adenosylcobinamide-GDP ribazoletransferase n=3 Tax=Geminicoccus harenae TaxID=2498453 RepID=UPI00210288DE|nr:adenosylcobinamide-GDP ribazoletransferase [Geminicoccus harenae]
MLHDVKLALQFLTRLPIRTDDPAGMAGIARAAWAFPLAGLVVAAAAALTFLLADRIGLPPVLAAILALAASIALTGALHEDGLADLFDALGGHAGRARALEIMRDSRIGTYGTLALLVTLALRAGALAMLATPGRVALALAGAACLSRAAMAVTMALQHPARPDGLGAAAGQVTPARAAIATALASLCLLAAAGPVQALPALVAAAGTLALTMHWTRRRLGGFTGDTLGATQQLVETACLLAAVAGQRMG